VCTYLCADSGGIQYCMDNRELAKVFRDIARLLEYKGENKFKTRAYDNASRIIKDYSEELSVIVDRGGDLKEIAGIGEAIELKIRELLSAGRLEFFERLKAEIPEGTLELMDIPGIGPKTAARLAATNGITSVEDLERALTESGADGISGIRASTAERALLAIRARRNRSD